MPQLSTDREVTTVLRPTCKGKMNAPVLAIMQVDVCGTFDDTDAASKSELASPNASQTHVTGKQNCFAQDVARGKLVGQWMDCAFAKGSQHSRVRVCASGRFEIHQRVGVHIHACLYTLYRLPVGYR